MVRSGVSTVLVTSQVVCMGRNNWLLSLTGRQHRISGILAHFSGHCILQSTIPTGYRPQIDGLRTIAMVGVLYVHFWGGDSTTEHLRTALFFVISGFLITQQLLAAREANLQLKIRSFYIRRLLRLMPPLLLMLAVAGYFNILGIRSSLWMHCLQLSNIHFAQVEDFDPWITSQLWSLNAVEQFYVVWPFVILLVPMRHLFRVMLLLLFAVLLLRVNGDEFGLNGWWRNIVFVHDPIIVGALTCLMARNRALLKELTATPTLVMAIAVIASPYLLGPDFGASEYYRIAIQPALAALTLGAYRGYGGLVGYALNNPITAYVTKISYGVFVYHLALWWMVVEHSSLEYDRGAGTFTLMLIVSAGVATLSWELVEKPLSRLKRHFPIGVARQ